MEQRAPGPILVPVRFPTPKQWMVAPDHESVRGPAIPRPMRPAPVDDGNPDQRIAVGLTMRAIPFGQIGRDRDVIHLGFVMTDPRWAASKSSWICRAYWSIPDIV